MFLKNIKEQIELGLLREDLYYRLGVVPIEMPDLKNHSQDIPDLVKYYMSSSAATLNKPIRTLSDDALACLQQYDWPGNLNELRNIIDWLLIMAPNNNNGMQVDNDKIIKMKNPLVGSEAKAWTEVNRPDLTIKVPNSENEKPKIPNKIVQL